MARLPQQQDQQQGEQRDREHHREGDVVGAGGVEHGGAEIGADAAENLMYHGDQAGEGPEMAGAEALSATNTTVSYFDHTTAARALPPQPIGRPAWQEDG